VQLVLQTANIIQTYTSGAVPGSFAVTVPLAVERPLLFYPFDAYCGRPGEAQEPLKRLEAVTPCKLCCC
jgi:hypothetical protein